MSNLIFEMLVLNNFKEIFNSEINSIDFSQAKTNFSVRSVSEYRELFDCRLAVLGIATTIVPLKNPKIIELFGENEIFLKRIMLADFAYKNDGNLEVIAEEKHDNIEAGSPCYLVIHNGVESRSMNLDIPNFENSLEMTEALFSYEKHCQCLENIEKPQNHFGLNEDSEFIDKFMLDSISPIN